MTKCQLEKRRHPEVFGKVPRRVVGALGVRPLEGPTTQSVEVDNNGEFVT